MFSFWKKSEKSNGKSDSILETLKFKEQFESQLKILEKVGLIVMLPIAKSLGVIGVDDKEYPIPVLEEIIKRLEVNKELVKKKIDQGFIKIILVPFACSLEKIAQKYAEAVVNHFKQDSFFATKEKSSDENVKLGVNEKEPLNLWKEYKEADKNGQLVYFPKAFDPKTHGGKTKIELLPNPEFAWTILLLEDMPNIPREGKGKTTKDRKRLETKKSPKEYFQMLQENKNYRGEEGLTLEAELVYAITELEEKNQVINDWQGQGNISCQIDAYFPYWDAVPWFGWDRDFMRLDLWKSNIADKPDPHIGTRTGIRI